MRTIVRKLGLILSFFICVVVSLTTRAISQQANKDKIDKASQDIQQLVKDVFHGDKSEEVKSSINPGAYIIEGSSYQSLFGSLYGNKESSALAQEKDRQMSFH